MKLKAKARNALPTKDFAEPTQRKYPVPDKGHAVAAKSRASEMANRGRISGAAEKSIDRKADAVIERMSKHKAPK